MFADMFTDFGAKSVSRYTGEQSLTGTPRLRNGDSHDGIVLRRLSSAISIAQIGQLLPEVLLGPGATPEAFAPRPPQWPGP
jgi:hypothetical protein